MFEALGCTVAANPHSFVNSLTEPDSDTSTVLERD